MKACDEYVSPEYSPDHARGSIAHGGIFWLDELLVVVDATVDFIIFFACQLLLKGNNRFRLGA